MLASRVQKHIRAWLLVDAKLVQGQWLALQVLAPAQAQLEEPDPGASERPASILCDDFTGVPLEV